MTTVMGFVLAAVAITWYLALQSVAAFAVELHHVQVVISTLLGGN